MACRRQAGVATTQPAVHPNRAVQAGIASSPEPLPGDDPPPDDGDKLTLDT
jgi:hypothetical protein